MPGRTQKHPSRTCNRILRGLGWAGIVWVGIVLASPAWPQSSDVRYQQALLAIQQHIEANDLEGARVLISDAIARFPNDGGIENLLGVVEIQQGHADRARQAFSAAIQNSPRLVSAYLNLGRVEMETAAEDPGGRAQALNVYEKLLKFEPENPEANYQAATLMMWSKQYQGSLNHLARLNAQARSGVGVQSLICADEAGLGHKEAANRAAANVIASPDLNEQIAMIILPALRSARRADLVERIFAAAGDRHALSVQGLRVLGLAQEAEGKLVEARSTLERAYSADPSSVVPLVDLARVANASKDYRGALGYLAHARVMRPRDASLAYEFGITCAQLNLFGEARKAISEAVAMEPENPRYNLGMGTVASFEHDPMQALPYLEKYHALRPDDAEGLLALGTTYFRAKDYDNAAPWLKQAAAKPGTAALAKYYLGSIAREKGNLEEAIADLTESDRLKPHQPEVMAELGQIYVQMKRYTDAEKQLNAALALDPDSYAANFGLLQLYVRTGDKRRADQAKRFEAVKDKNEQESREMMRVIEIVPQDKQAQ